MKSQTVSILITDLDNTIWDWVAIWYHPFRAMLNVVLTISGLDEDDLLMEIKQVFTHYGTTEYSHLLQELPSLQQRYPGEDLASIFSEAINAYRKTRREVIGLYPDVIRTLTEIRQRGVCVVAYTESRAFYTGYRIRKTGLDGVIDIIYSPKDHSFPKGVSREEMRIGDPTDYNLNTTVHRFTPAEVIKPNAAVLLSILDDLDIDPENAIYLGDSLYKDIVMAQSINVRDVHAAYGNKDLNSPEYDLLKRVTHWSDQQVQEEQEAELRIVANYTLENSISEILNLFNFIPGHINKGELA